LTSCFFWSFSIGSVRLIVAPRRARFPPKCGRRGGWSEPAPPSFFMLVRARSAVISQTGTSPPEGKSFKLNCRIEKKHGAPADVRFQMIRATVSNIERKPCVVQ